MAKTNFRDLIFPIFLSLVGIFGSWISNEYRTILIILFLFGIAIYFLADIYRKIDENEEKIQGQDLKIMRLNEKVKIYEELINIKADISLLKRSLK